MPDSLFPGDSSLRDELGRPQVRHLYVDLDGSVLRGSLTFECLATLAKRRPTELFKIPLWALRGTAYLRSRVADSADVEVSLLPYRRDIVEYLGQRRALGDRIILVTASNGGLASRIAAHLELFDDIIASTPERRLKDGAKTQAVVAHAQGKPFGYLGSSASDPAIWSHASAATIVDLSGTQRADVGAVTSIEQEFVSRARGWTAAVRAARIHHWLKNMLIFLPLLTSHAWTRPRSVAGVMLAFAAFSLTASAVYILNDLLDLPSDRRHPQKRNRPLASGALPIAHGFLLVPVLLAAGVAISLAVGTKMLLILAIYVGITTAYSMVLKTYILIDVVVLAALYTIRVIAGAAAIPITPSFWLLAFSGFLFLSLALLKRYSDLVTLAQARQSSAAGRDYQVSDLPILQTIGVGTGIAAVVVLALYVNSPDVLVLYRHPQWLSLLCVTALYGVMRLWIKAARGELQKDPILYAAGDPSSLVLAVLSVAIVLVGL